MASTASLSPAARRELTRSYKEAPPRMGVYAIRNLAEPRVLVGASANPQGALNRHRFELDRRQHRNAALLQDWLRLGPEAFRFEVLDAVKPGEEPGRDLHAELEALLALWREELLQDAASYDVLAAR